MESMKLSKKNSLTVIGEEQERRTNTPKSTMGSENSGDVSVENLVRHLCEILGVLIEDILSKADSMPFLMRLFFKLIYEECHDKWGHILTKEIIF